MRSSENKPKEQIPATINFLDRELRVIKKLAHGRSSTVFQVRDQQRIRALKIEKTKSRRVDMVQKETRNLQAANRVGVGPDYLETDAQQKAILMECIKGEPFGTWVLKANRKNQFLVLKKLFAQAEALDAAGLDHGQLAGKMHNILIGPKNRVTILDFEKASLGRKTHNLRQLQGFLLRNPRGTIALHLRKTLLPRQMQTLNAWA